MLIAIVRVIPKSPLFGWLKSQPKVCKLWLLNQKAMTKSAYNFYKCFFLVIGVSRKLFCMEFVKWNKTQIACNLHLRIPLKGPINYILHNSHNPVNRSWLKLATSRIPSKSCHFWKRGIIGGAIRTSWNWVTLVTSGHLSQVNINFKIIVSLALNQKDTFNPFNSLVGDDGVRKCKYSYCLQNWSILSWCLWSTSKFLIFQTTVACKLRSHHGKEAFWNCLVWIKILAWLKRLVLKVTMKLGTSNLHETWQFCRRLDMCAGCFLSPCGFHPANTFPTRLGRWWWEPQLLSGNPMGDISLI